MNVSIFDSFNNHIIHDTWAFTNVCVMCIKWESSLNALKIKIFTAALSSSSLPFTKGEMCIISMIQLEKITYKHAKRFLCKWWIKIIIMHIPLWILKCSVCELLLEMAREKFVFQARQHKKIILPHGAFDWKLCVFSSYRLYYKFES